MKASELKFVLKLLGHEGYRALISEIKLNDKTRAAERDKICRELAERGIVDFSYEVKQFKIEPPGTALLKQDITQLPVSKQQISVLKACVEKSVKSGDVKIPAAERQAVIQDLEAKGLIKAIKVQIKEVWLTNQGKEYLREDCNPSGTGTISLNLLQNYLTFLRKTLTTATVESSLPETSSNVSTTSDKPDKPSDAEVLQTIRKLDQELGTDNYLPIFHLRKQLQPPLSRDELDQVLYHLQREDKIEISTLQEGNRYESEQVAAGISQPVGGPLFFIEIL